MTHTDAALTAITPGGAEAAGAGGSLAQPDLPGTGGEARPELLQHRLFGRGQASLWVSLDMRGLEALGGSV